MKVTGRITNDQYVKVTAETTTNFCLVNDSDSSARISYRPEDIFASAVNGSAPIFCGRDFSAKEVNGNGGSCLVVARISDYAWEHAAARYLLRHHHLHGLSGNGQRRGLSPR